MIFLSSLLSFIVAHIFTIYYFFSSTDSTKLILANMLFKFNAIAIPVLILYSILFDDSEKREYLYWALVPEIIITIAAYFYVHGR